MDAQVSQVYSELNPAKKDAKWFDNTITILRRDWMPLVSREKAIKGRKILFSQQSMEKIKASYQDEEFLKSTDFTPLGIWSRILNIIIEEVRSNPPEMQVRANDESAMLDKKSDIRRLVTMNQHQQSISTLNARVGLPPYTIGDDKFKTNIKDMLLYQLDPSDKEDIDFFHRNDFIRLKQEIAAQKLLDAVFKNINFDSEFSMDAIIDIFSTNCFCLFKYVDEVSGELKIERSFPEETYGIWGNKRDGKKDICNGFIKNVPIRDWISMAGNDFDFERDWYQLLWALNYSNGSTYTGFSQGGRDYDGRLHRDYEKDCERMGSNFGATNNFLSWEQAFTYNVQVGYIDWCSIDATKTWLEKKGKNGQVEVGKSVPYTYNLDDREVTEGWSKESNYNEQFYKSFFLPTSGVSQWIYNFGKLNYQELEGVNDEYSCGAMVCYRQEGITAAEISEFYINMANFAAYRILWLLSKVEPNREEYVWEEMVELAGLFKREFQQDNQNNPSLSLGNIIEDIVKTQRTSHVRLRAYPRINNRKSENLHKIEVQKAGDPAAVWIQAIEKWAEDSIAEKIGLNDVRMGQVRNDRMGQKTAAAETEQSQKSTGYVYRIIQFVKEKIATKVLNTAQDAVAFEDSVVCRWISTMVGEVQFNNLLTLKGKAAHRLGLFVENHNTSSERARLMQVADMALQNRDGQGGISLPEWGIVTREKDPRQGLALLEMYREKARKRARKEKIEDDERKQKAIMEQKKAESDLQDKMHAQAMQLKGEDAKKEAMVAEIGANAKMQSVRDRLNAEPAKQADKAEATKEVATHKNNLEQQEAF